MARQYTEDFKKDAIQYLKDHPELDKHEVSKYLGVPYDTLYGWYKKARRESTPEAYDEHCNLTEAEKENMRLRRELRDAKDAIEILKKAIGILGN